MASRESAYRDVLGRIEAAEKERAARTGEHRSVRLVAVSKRQSAEAIAALADLGQRDFAENYLQEGMEKQAALAGRRLTWHFIGPIQSNKTRSIAEHFDWVHSVDRIKLIRRLGEQRDPAQNPLNVLLQVNVDDEASKAGASPAEVPALVEEFAGQPTLRLRGLMCIPRPGNTQAFESLAELNAALPRPLPDLSMGMSGDFEAAIAAGSTIVRVGTALFGRRD